MQQKKESQSARVWRRFPPAEHQWEETLRGVSPPNPKKSPGPIRSMSSLWEGDLNDLISYSIAQLKQTRSGSQDSPAKVKDQVTVSALLKGAESVKQRWSVQGSKGQVVLHAIDRTQRSERSSRVETEPMQSIEEEDPDECGRILFTEETPKTAMNSDDLSTPKASPLKRLQAELRQSRAKCRRLEGLYAALLTRRQSEGGNAHLLERHAREKVGTTQAAWMAQEAEMKREIERLKRENQKLREKADEERPTESHPSADYSLLHALQTEVDCMKLRIAKTEQDNADLRSRLP